MVPEDRRYSKDHEWVKVEGQEAVVGITDYAQDQLGDMVYVDLPQVGQALEQFKTFGVAESVKAASDLYAPVSGEVIAVNEQLGKAPEKVNQDPYGSGWMIRVRLKDPAEVDNLLDAQQYEKEIQGA